MKKLCEYIYESLEDDVNTLLNYLHGSPDSKIVKKLVNAYTSVALEDGDIKQYIIDSGLDVILTRQVIVQLDDDDQSVIYSMLANHEKLPNYDPVVPLTEFFRSDTYKNLGFNISDEGLSTLLSANNKHGNISVGPGELAVCLLCKDARHADKGDVACGPTLYEFKFGGRLVTATSKGTIYQVWEKASNELGVNNVSWRPSNRGKETLETGEKVKVIHKCLIEWYDSILSKFNKDKSAANTALARALIKYTGEFFGQTGISGVDEAQVVSVLGEISKGPIKDIGEGLIRVEGALCVLAYRLSEKFTGLVVQDKDRSGNYTKAAYLGPEDMKFDELYRNASITFTSPNANDKFGGMFILPTGIKNK